MADGIHKFVVVCKIYQETLKYISNPMTFKEQRSQHRRLFRPHLTTRDIDVLSFVNCSADKKCEALQHSSQRTKASIIGEHTICFFLYRYIGSTAMKRTNCVLLTWITILILRMYMVENIYVIHLDNNSVNCSVHNLLLYI